MGDLIDKIVMRGLDWKLYIVARLKTQTYFCVVYFIFYLPEKKSIY